MRMAPDTVHNAWQRFWFAEGSAYDLAAARIVFGVHGLWMLLSRDLPAMAGVPSAFWEGMRPTVQWRYFIFPGQPGVEYGLQLVAIVALIAVVAGVRPQLAALTAALLLYHLSLLETGFWNADPGERGFEVTILALVVLAFARSGDRWAAGKRDVFSPGSGECYGWPLRLIQLFVVQVYFFSGYAKLAGAGIPWISGDNLRRWLLAFNQVEANAVFDSLGPFLADQPAVMTALAFGTVAFELGFPIVLLWSRSRRFLVPLALLFHLGILFGMNIMFLNTPHLLVFVNWHWLRSRRSGSWIPEGRGTLRATDSKAG